MLPIEFMKDFTGKVCSISLFNSGDIRGRIEGVENNWLKVCEKGKSRLINGDMVRDIRVLPDKYQH